MVITKDGYDELMRMEIKTLRTTRGIVMIIVIIFTMPTIALRMVVVVIISMAIAMVMQTY